MRGVIVLWFASICGAFNLSDSKLNMDLPHETCPSKCICTTNFTTVNCNRRQLVEVPEHIPSSVVVLYLGHNYIKKLEKNAFKKLNVLRDLYLNNNKISMIEGNAFAGLDSLKLLSFTGNSLADLSSDALTELKGLEKLYLTKNKLKDIPDFVSVPMSYLTYLTLDTNHLENANICKGKNTTVFNQLGTLVLSNNFIQSLENANLACINPNKLTKINLSRNKLSTIMEDAFSSLQQLQSVSISYNADITWQALQNFTTSLSSNKNLSSLDLSGVFVTKELKLNDATFAKLTNSSIRYLLLAKSANVSIIEKGTFSHFPKLEVLDLSKGKIVEIDDLFESTIKLKDLRLHENEQLQIAFIKQLKIQSLKFLDLRKVIIEVLDNDLFSGFPNLEVLTMARCKIRTIYSHSFDGLGSLRKLDLSANAIAGTSMSSQLFSGCLSLIEIDLSYNKMTYLSSEYTLFQGLFQLERLDLSNNDCVNVSEGLFKDLKNLKYLSISQNKLGHYFSTLDKLPNLFKSQERLITLNLQENDISTLPDNIFDGLTSSRTINLSSNNFISVNPLLYKYARNLENLDLSKNRFAHINPEVVIALPSQVSINLSHNPFDCSCDLRPFMYWLLKQNSSFREFKLAKLSTYKCSSPLSMSQQPLLTFDPDSITAFCNWVYILATSLLGLFIVVLGAGLMLFRYRWHIRLHWYLFKRRLRSGKNYRRHRRTTYGSIPTDDAEEKFSYRITISYNDDDKDWVFDELIARLEQWNKGTDVDCMLESYSNQSSNVQCNLEPSEGFLFAIGYNSNPCESSFVQLCDAMMKSTRIIHCISRSYLKDQKNKSEMMMAFQSRQELEVDAAGDEGLFLILLEPGVDVRLPNILLPIRKANKFCQWSEKDVEMKLFWNDISKILKIKADKNVAFC